MSEEADGQDVEQVSRSGTEAAVENDVDEAEDELTRLRQQLHQQLQESGLADQIRHHVEEFCKSTCEDLSKLRPEAVVEQIYTSGVMGSVMEQFEKGTKRSVANVPVAESLHSAAKLPSLLPTFLDMGDVDFNSKTQKTQGSCGGRRYYLKVDIGGGKGFLDHLSHTHSGQISEGRDNLRSTCKMKLVLHVFYKSQRFATQPVDCCCDPHFKDSFMIDIGYFHRGGSVLELMEIKEPLRILIVRENLNRVFEDVNHSSSVVSFSQHDWRSVLVAENGTESFTLDLMGIGSEYHTTIGILSISMAVMPLPDQRLSEKTYMTRIIEEKASAENVSRKARSVIKKWRKDFLGIRETHILRNVQILVFDENMISRCVTTFVELIECDRELITPFAAAWFTALIPTTKTGRRRSSKMTSPEPVDEHNDYWQSLETTLCSAQGGVEDHAVLLCSLFLGLGMNALVTLGSRKSTTKWAWVSTLDSNFQPTFWESTTGRRYKPLTIPLVSKKAEHNGQANDKHGYQAVGCLFNNDCFYANIQPTDSINDVSWNINDPTKWKCIPVNVLKSIHRPKQNITLQSSISPNECNLLTLTLEKQLKHVFATLRMKQGRLIYWDDAMGKLMGQQIVANELKASTGATEVENFFDCAMMNHLQSGYDFKGFQFHTSYIHKRKIGFVVEDCVSDIKFQEALTCTGDDLKFAIRVMAFPYPEKVVSLRIIIGATFLPTS